MKLRDHVLYAIDDSRAGKHDAALLHACMAIDGTATRLYPSKGVKHRYIDCLRNYYWLLEAMTGAGIDLVETRFGNIHLAKLNAPDFSEIIYYIFRCSHAHAEEVPDVFSLTPTEGGFGSSWVIGHNELHMPDRVVWALLSVTVFSRVNNGEFTTGTYYLSLGSERFTISDWWGRENDFRPIAERYNQVRVKLDALERLEKLSGEPNHPAIEHVVIKQPFMG
jgi:hypothetical protein